MDKRKNHMSYFGIGPIYVTICIVLTVFGIEITKHYPLTKGVIQNFNILFKVISVICIAIGLILWISSVLISKIDKNIKENKLVNTGVYAWVRNPIYSAFAFIFTGILFWQNNIFLLIFPLSFWLIMTILIKKEETILRNTFGQQYIDYAKQVNRCIPWFPKK